MFRTVKRISQNYRKGATYIDLRAIYTNQVYLNKEKNEKKKEPSDYSFIQGIFRGVIEPRDMFPFPSPLSREQLENVQMLVDPFTKFLEENLKSAKYDETGKVDDEFMNGLWETGVFGLQVAPELGGLGLSNTQVTRMVQIIGANDLAIGVMIGAHQSIGFKGILLFGTPEQKQKYLPLVSSGKKFAAFALTEPTAGSDAGSIRTRAVLSPDGKHYIINGSKIWITNGGTAEIFTVFAKTPIIDPATGETKEKMSAFIVERAFGGITSGPPESKMGIKASNTTEVFFEDTKVPVENVLGEIGNGFKIAMNILNNGRFGMVGTLSGTMKACIKKAVEFATTRTQFGRKISSFGIIQEKIARMAMLQYVTESLAFMLSGNMDSGSTNFHLEAALCKCFASESAWTVCDEAIQVMGGMGFMKHTELERVLRDLRIFKIFEGTNEVLRMLVALSGIKLVGSQLIELQKAFKHPTANISLIINAFTTRTAYKIGIKRPPSMENFIHDDLQEQADMISSLIETFAFVVEKCTMTYGKSIMDQQFILSRIANCVMDIYTSTVVLSRASKSLREKLPSAEYERNITIVWCTESYVRARATLKTIHPVKSVTLNKLSRISLKVFEAGGIVQLSPLKF